MTIALTALKEKLRRKELYIVSVIGVLIVIMFTTGAGQISIDGVAVTDYKMLSPIILIVINAVCCILSVIMSLSTIPNEYERHTSHLIWIRKVPQSRYHGELALANIMSGLISELILFVSAVIFILSKNRGGEIIKLLPAFLVIAVNVIIVCLMTSAFSIFLPKTAAGFISAFIALCGIFHGLLMLLKDILGGFAGGLIKVILTVIPDLNEVQAQAGNILSGSEFEIHPILKGLLFAYIFAVIIMLVKKREA